MKRVLITGTTSGLGKALTYEYVNRGWEVIAVNRRANPDSIAQQNYVCDVCDQKGIRHLLEQERDVPIDLYLLNAGINRVDTINGKIDKHKYEEVFAVNYFAWQDLWQFALLKTNTLRHHPVFVCFSSTSIFLPNPNCQAYSETKLRIFNDFRHHPGSSGFYMKRLVLGPIATNICVTNTGSHFQNWVRKVITVSPERAARRIANFLDGNGRTLYYPLPVCALFWLAGKINRVMPLYRGSK